VAAPSEIENFLKKMEKIGKFSKNFIEKMRFLGFCPLPEIEKSKILDTPLKGSARGWGHFPKKGRN
jgi:hypothetical protein